MNEGDHHWSGWPGAHCLRCGMEDPTEVCMALECGTWVDCTCSEEAPCEKCSGTGVLSFQPCILHQPVACPPKAEGGGMT
jgi:hypothetical protein